MFDSLSIANFRAFKKLDVSPLHRVNLIAGGNNVGKTSVLEAIWFAVQEEPLSPTAPSIFRRSATVKAQDDQDNFWKWLFFQKDTTQSISLKLLASNTPAAERSTTIKFERQRIHLSVFRKNIFDPELMESFPNSTPPPVCTTLTTSLPSPVDDAERVNAVSVLNRDDELVGYLRMIDPKISKLKYLKLPGHDHPYVYADVGFGAGKELIPVTQLGQGIARMLGLFSSLMTEKTQILLIDEFENGLQHDALVPVWNALGQFARDHDVQIFATTHSYECIAAAYEAFTDAQDDLAVIKLRQDPELGIASFVLDYEHIGIALKTEMEIR